MQKAQSNAFVKNIYVNIKDNIFLQTHDDTNIAGLIKNYNFPIKYAKKIFLFFKITSYRMTNVCEKQEIVTHHLGLQ